MKLVFSKIGIIIVYGKNHDKYHVLEERLKQEGYFLEVVNDGRKSEMLANFNETYHNIKAKSQDVIVICLSRKMLKYLKHYQVKGIVSIDTKLGRLKDLLNMNCAIIINQILKSKKKLIKVKNQYINQIKKEKRLLIFKRSLHFEKLCDYLTDNVKYIECL